MLAPTDYEITEVESGEEALAAIAKQAPARSRKPLLGGVNDIVQYNPICCGA
jgi:hypothetical protein